MTDAATLIKLRKLKEDIAKAENDLSAVLAEGGDGPNENNSVSGKQHLDDARWLSSMPREFLPRVIQRKERRLNDTVRDVESRAADSIRRHALRVASREQIPATGADIRDLSEEGIDTFLRTTSRRVKGRAKVKLESEIQRERFQGMRPPWCLKLDEIYELLENRGYANQTRWRSLTRCKLLALEAAFRESEGSCGSTVNKVRACIDAINAVSSIDMRKRLKDIEFGAHSAEDARDPGYARCHEDAVQAQFAVENFVSRDKDALSRKMHCVERRRGGMRARIAACNKVVDSTNYSESEVAADGNRRRVRRAPDDDYSVAQSLASFGKVPAERDNRDMKRGRYHHMLANCSSKGDWQGALRIYDALLAQRLQPTPFTFRAIISCCKRAEPCQVAKAINVLDEMVVHGIQPDVTTYNSLIDGCRLACQWRRSLQVFARLCDSSIEPNTHTYTLVARACSTAPLADAPEVYTAMKFAGIPEYVCYTASASICDLN